MKIKWLILTGAVALSAFTTAQATPITGEVDMSGTVTLNNIFLGSASAATAFSAVTVGGIPTGSFVGTAGDSVTWHAFSWPGGSASPLWSYTDVGTGDTYSFALSTDSIVSQSNTFLNLLGAGTLSISGPGGYTPTTGTWSFTISNPDGSSHANFAFTFANSQTSVPDGGSTAAMLGLALSAIGLVVRKARCS